MELLDGQTLKHRIGERPAAPSTTCSNWAFTSPTRSMRRTRAASSTATSSRRTSSSPAAARPRCWISASPSSRRATRKRRGDSGVTIAAAEHHRPRRDGRHGRVHVAGAGARARPRRAHRSLFVRRRAVRDGDGHAAVHRHDVGGDLRRDPGQVAGVRGAAQSVAARRAGTHHQQGAREGSPAALSARVRHAERPQASPARHVGEPGDSGGGKHLRPRSATSVPAPTSVPSSQPPSPRLLAGAAGLSP